MTQGQLSADRLSSLLWSDRQPIQDSMYAFGVFRNIRRPGTAGPPHDGPRQRHCKRLSAQEMLLRPGQAETPHLLADLDGSGEDRSHWNEAEDAIPGDRGKPDRS